MKVQYTLKYKSGQVIGLINLVPIHSFTHSLTNNIGFRILILMPDNIKIYITNYAFTYAANNCAIIFTAPFLRFIF